MSDHDIEHDRMTTPPGQQLRRGGIGSDKYFSYMSNFDQ
jgi:hypothetical protein